MSWPLIARNVFLLSVSSVGTNTKLQSKDKAIGAVKATVAAPMLGANTANILLCQGFVGQVAVATKIHTYYY